MRYYKTGTATTCRSLVNQERKRKKTVQTKDEFEVGLICFHSTSLSSPLTPCYQVHSLVPVDRHPLLRAPAQLPVSGRRDGPAASCTGGARLLEGQQLLGAEGLVVDLGGSLDQVLEVCAREEVAQVDEFTVGLVLNYQLLDYEK